MTREDIAVAVADLVRAQLGARAAPPPDDDLALHLDSLQRLALVVALEDRFRICFEPADADAARTQRQVVALIERRLADGGAGHV